MCRNLVVYVDKLIDVLECIQDANNDKIISSTIDEVIDVVYELSTEQDIPIVESDEEVYNRAKADATIEMIRVIMDSYRGYIHDRYK